MRPNQIIDKKTLSNRIPDGSKLANNNILLTRVCQGTLEFGRFFTQKVIK